MKLSVRRIPTLLLIFSMALVLMFTQAPAFSVSASSEETLPDPVIVTFDSAASLENKDCEIPRFTGNLTGIEGSQEFTTYKGVNCIKLNYSYTPSLPNYRMAFNFKTSGKLTEQHGWIRVTYATDSSVLATINLVNNGNLSDAAILAGNTTLSKGEWVRSDAAYFADGKMLERFCGTGHCTFGFTSILDDASVYIQEIGFFCSEEQAYEWYNDAPSEGNSNISYMSFGVSNATGKVESGANYGNATVNTTDNCVDIAYAEKDNWSGNTHYMAKLKPAKQGVIDQEHKYMRVLYSAKNPENETDPVVLRLLNDASNDKVIINNNVTNTDGSFVLSDTVVVPDSIMQRFGEWAVHCSFVFGARNEGGLYQIKTVYFFATEDAANNFESPEGVLVPVTLNGNNIEDYQIVIPRKAPTVIKTAADALADRFETLTKTRIPIVTDEAPQKSGHEILVGASNRELSSSVLAEITADPDPYYSYIIKLFEDGTLVVSSKLPAAIEDAVTTVNKHFFFDGQAIPPEEIVHSSDATQTAKGISTNITDMSYYHPDLWAEITNVADPEVFIDDFNSDDGYFTEEENNNDFTISGGKMHTEGEVNDPESDVLTFIQVFEGNAKAKAEFTLAGIPESGNFGLMLRYTAPDAYVKGGYDFESGCYYIESREGADFYLMRAEGTEATLVKGETVTLEFLADGETLTLWANGEKVATMEKVAHITPGRPAIYSSGVPFSVDDYELTLLSGQGKIIRNITHTKLPDELYREGGSVIEMSDGSLNYTHHSGANFKSTDNGKTWVRIDPWTTYTGYANIIRLNNGKLLKMGSLNGYVCSWTSTDDGATWVRGNGESEPTETSGQICPTLFQNNAELDARSQNMNDKILQTASGRLLYSQNYATEGDATFNGRTVFCQFFTSNDNGETWTEIGTGSWEIEGNEDHVCFGECKLLECADGTIRMYNSYNSYGCIVYSDFNEETGKFGPLVKMEDFTCSRSSMQFVRDRYGENDYTYYMVWVNNQDNQLSGYNFPRSTLTLAKSTDGKNWEVLGDLWRWQSNYRFGSNGSMINHIVDPFINTNEDYVIVGTGLSEVLPTINDNRAHGAQRQHIWTIEKASHYPEIKADADKTYADVGENITVDVTMYDKIGFDSEINALNFALNYDNTKLELVSVSVNNELGENFILNGTKFGWYSTTGVAIEETGLNIATFTFRVKDELTPPTAINITLGDKDGTRLCAKLADRADVFIPDVTDPDKIIVAPEGFVKFVSRDLFPTLNYGTQLLMISAQDNEVTYTLGDAEFYYSPKYKAYVAIVDDELTELQVLTTITSVKTPDGDVLEYDGDIVNAVGVNASDAAIISEMLHHPERDYYDDRMRLEADVCDTLDVNGAYVTVADALWILYKSVGKIIG